MARAARLWCASLLFVLASGCHSGVSPTAPGGAVGTRAGAAVVTLHAGTRSLPVRVELARTESERERGLMYRNRLDTDAGMLFIFETDAPLTFWMKNTFIPLDMIFIDHQRRVVGIVENAAPETETPRHVNGSSRYVLEIGGGLSQRWGVVAGSTVDFQGVPLDSMSN